MKAVNKSGVLSALMIAALMPSAFAPVCATAQGAGSKAAIRAEMNKRSEQRTVDKRKEIVSEAVSTIRETQDALKLLDEGKNKEALGAVERATGKLETVLARDPKVSLVPMSVAVVTKDVYTSLDAIKKAKADAEQDLRAGRVQEARRLLDALVSETVISTTNIPLATYPDALKKSAKLIDENKTVEAKAVLQSALDTLVVADIVVPIPVVVARIDLEKAEELSKKNNRTQQQNKELSELLTAADTEIDYAQALGYGKPADFDAFRRQAREIKTKTAGGKSGTDFFQQIKTYIESMTKDSQHKITK